MPAARPRPAIFVLRPPRLLKSAGFRFAVLFATLFAASALALVAVLWWATTGAVDRGMNTAILADAQGLVGRFRIGGAAAVSEAIDDRLAVDVQNEQIYLLVGADGTRLAGNLDRWPEAVSGDGAWVRTRVMHDGAERDARLNRVSLPGHALLVGRDETERAELRGLLTEGVLWASGTVLLFALIGAALTRLMLDARLRPAFATTAAIAAGDLASRVPLSGRGDEFDQLAQTVNAMLDRIAALMEGVRGVSDAIAHDLRTPIARLRATLEEALTADVDSPASAPLRTAIERGIVDLDGISRTFQALLRIAEAEAGARRAAFASFDLVPVLVDAAEFYSVAAESRGQRLETSLPPTLPMLGDRDLLLQAVANLLDNAIKFTPEGGTVCLAARAEAGGIAVEVTDDGPGVPVADREHAADRFFRGDRARATAGSGLGLSLVQAVAQLHGGALRLADAVPGGAAPGLRATLALAVPPQRR